MTALIAIAIVTCSAPPAPAFFETAPPAPPAKLGYADVYRRVAAGESLTVAAGTADRADVTIDAIPGESPVMVRVTAPAMPAPTTGTCDCGSKPCGDANCQAHGGGGSCECKRTVIASPSTCSGPSCTIVTPAIVTPQYSNYPTYNGTCTGPNCPQSQPRQRFLYRLLIPEK
jgi:hypothetical protein